MAVRIRLKTRVVILFILGVLFTFKALPRFESLAFDCVKVLFLHEYIGAERTAQMNIAAFVMNG